MAAATQKARRFRKGKRMMHSITALPNTIDCPLCLGKGRLGRAKVLERLGMKDHARVAQLSAEEAIRLLAARE